MELVLSNVSRGTQRFANSSETEIDSLHFFVIFFFFLILGFRLQLTESFPTPSEILTESCLIISRETAQAQCISRRSRERELGLTGQVEKDP